MNRDADMHGEEYSGERGQTKLKSKTAYGNALLLELLEIPRSYNTDNYTKKKM